MEESYETDSWTAQNDVAGLVSGTSQVARELDDLMTGKRKVQKHKHHSIRSLVNAMVNGITSLLEVRREIRNGVEKYKPDPSD